MLLTRKFTYADLGADRKLRAEFKRTLRILEETGLAAKAKLLSSLASIGINDHSFPRIRVQKCFRRIENSTVAHLLDLRT